MSNVTVTYYPTQTPPQPMVQGQILSGVNEVGNLQGNVSVAALWAAMIAALPTTNPHTIGNPWWNGESISISQG